MTQNKILLYALYGLRKAGRKLGVLASPSPDSFLCSRYVELFDQEANDFVYETLREGKPCMISKFGTTELNAVVTDLVTSEPLSWSVLKEFFRGELSLSRVQSILQLQKLSGFFPVSPDYGRRFCERVVNDIPEINITLRFFGKIHGRNIWKGKRYWLFIRSSIRLNPSTRTIESVCSMIRTYFPDSRS